MLIQGAQVALPGARQLEPRDLRIQDGKITEIAEHLEPLPGEEVLDATGRWIFPGGIDPHVHFDTPGYTHREDFQHASRAAAAGGITTVIDMPCTSVPPVTSRANLEAKLEAVADQSVVDFGFHGGVSGKTFEERFPHNLHELREAGVFGIKTYLISGMETFPRVTLFQLERILEVARDLDLVVLLHAEDYDYVSSATAYFRQIGDGPWYFYRSRPEAAELLAIQAAVALARRRRAPLHIVHVGTAEAVEIINTAETVTCETAPHYLAFGLEDLQRIGAPLKTTPPVKPSANRWGLWYHLARGNILYVASDHAPAPAEEKNTPSFWQAYSGIPGVQTLFPYLLSEGLLAGRLSLSRFLEAIAEGAARRFGLDHRKGSLEVGKDADLVIVNPEATWTLQVDTSFYSKGKITPFEGMTFRGKIEKTLVRGRVVYDHQQGIVAPSGWGQFLRRTP